MRGNRGGRLKPSRATILLVAIALALVGNIATGTVRVDEPWWPWLVWSVVALLVFLALWLEWASTRRTGLEIVRTAEDALADMVTKQWRHEAKIRSLDDPDPIPVQWRLTAMTEVMDHPDNITRSAPLVGARANIGELTMLFRSLRRKRLVILGGPGSGKTTLAVQLVRELLDTRKNSEPVPVLLSVASWDTGKFTSLQDWLNARLTADYRAPELGEDAVRALVERGRVFPVLDVLDGLDGVPDSVRADVLLALNRSLERSDQLIVTSRTPEFAEAVESADVVTSTAVIEPDPLAPEVVADYLTSCLPPAAVASNKWRTVLSELRSAAPADPLAEVCSTPLGVWLVRIVYVGSGADPTPLLDRDVFPDTAALQSHLFDRLIPAVIEQRPPSTNRADLFRPRRPYHAEKVTRWLGYLASHLNRAPGTQDDEPSRDFAWWHLAKDLQPLSIFTYLALTAVFGVLFGRLGMALGYSGFLPFFLGAIVGASIALFLDGGRESLANFDTSNMNDSKWTPRSVFSCLFGIIQMMVLVVPLFALFVFFAFFTLLATVFSVLWYLITTGGVPIEHDSLSVLVGVIIVIAGPAFFYTTMIDFGEFNQVRVMTPIASWRFSRKLCWRQTAAGGLVGLALGVWSAIDSFEPRDALVFGSMGLVAGTFLFGITGGGTRSWPGYIAATYRLGARRLLPRRLMSFLDDMHRLGLLRAVGPIYQFRHAELQDHLVAGYPQPR